MKLGIIFLVFMVLFTINLSYSYNYERLCYDLENLGFNAPSRPESDPEVFIIEQDTYEYDDYRTYPSNITDDYYNYD